MAYRVVNFSPIHKIRDVPRSMELSTLQVTSNLLQSHDAKYQHSVGFLFEAHCSEWGTKQTFTTIHTVVTFPRL